MACRSMAAARFFAVAGVLALVSGAAAAQTAAPIVYKSPVAAYGAPKSLESRVDPLSLNVAPHAPIPTFFDSAPMDLRPGAPVATFGPAPMAATPLAEPLPLKTSAVAPRPATREQQMMTPYAGPAYQVAGRWYVPAHEPNYDEVGIASWYGPTFHGKPSANGETFDENAMTAAHPTLPIPSLVRVTNLENGRSVVVRLNDRGPFVDDRIIDLSKAAGAALDMHAKGTAKVRVQYVGPAPAEGGGGISAAPPAQRQNVVAAPLPPVVQAAPAPAPVRALPQAGSAQTFYVQAGSFADLANAHQTREKLGRHGQVSIEAATVNGSEFYRVLVGPWGDRGEADAARTRLAGAGTQGVVVSRSR